MPSEPTFDASVVGAPAGEGEISWTIAFRNSGKRIATLISTKIYMKVGAAAFQCVNYCKEGSKGSIAQDISDYITGWWPAVITKDQFDSLMKVGGAIQIYIPFRYQDEDGKTYTTPICLTHFSNNSVGDCSASYKENDFK